MLERVLSFLIGLFLFLLMMITAVDVFGRYIFNYPLVGSIEMTEFILGLVIFSTIILLNRKNEHIAVDILEKKFNDRFRKLRDLLVHLFTLIGLGVTIYGIYILAKRSVRDQLVSEYLQWPVALFDYLSAGLLAVSFIFTIANLFNFISSKKNIDSQKSEQRNI